jgi:hypothetical protein
VSFALDVPRTFLFIYLDGILFALLGALIAARQPRNSIGWLMIALGWLAGLFQVIAAYGYAALGVYHGAWPLGSLVAWIGAWIWGPTIGFIALLTVRFPDGHIGRFGRSVDVIYAVGTTLFVLPVAFATPSVELSFSSLPAARLADELPYFHDPVTSYEPTRLLPPIQGVAITLILLASIVAAVSLTLRYREAKGDERVQIRWFAFAAALCATAVVYGAVAWWLFAQPFYLAFTPLELVALAIPASIGIAILRYRLYDIDLIINRTLVYGGMTAVLAALYAATVALLNRLFISVSGQKSDTAFFVTAFFVVVAASPVRDWLQRQVDRRVRHASPATVLEGFRSNVDAVVSVMDVNRVAQSLLDQALEAFDARGAELYLNPSEKRPAYTRGHIKGEAEVEVILRFEDRQYGRLVLGSRRGDIEYTQPDRALLQRSADSVAEALALGSQLSFKPSATNRTKG